MKKKQISIYEMNIHSCRFCDFLFKQYTSFWCCFCFVFIYCFHEYTHTKNRNLVINLWYMQVINLTAIFTIYWIRTNCNIAHFAQVSNWYEIQRLNRIILNQTKIVCKHSSQVTFIFMLCLSIQHWLFFEYFRRLYKAIHNYPKMSLSLSA